MRVLVTGGAGYVGSHIVLELLGRGNDVVVVDNLVRGHRAAVRLAEAVAGRAADLRVGDLCDRSFVEGVFAEAPVDAVVHCAAYKSVAESMAHPKRYERNNVEATGVLADAMVAAGVRGMVFSSSGSVYGDPESVPIAEDAPLRPMSPYARSKVDAERLLSDHVAGGRLDVVNLRFFNVCGAHPSGRLGEFTGTSTNLIPVLLACLDDKRPRVTVFGQDFDTVDGTCIRDYVHVCDVAAANLVALGKLVGGPGWWTYNVGTGRGASVLDVVRAVEEAAGQPIEVVIGDRRPGDPPAAVANVDKVGRELGFACQRDLEEMVRTALCWRRSEPRPTDDVEGSRL